MTDQRNKINEWLTSRPGGQDVTPELLRAFRIAATTLVVVLMFVAMLAALVAFTGQADGAMQSTPQWPVGCRVRVMFDQNYFVRPRAGGNITGNPVLKSISTKDGWFDVDKVEGQFFHITGKDTNGWILQDGLDQDCSALTPTATPTATRAATATSTPRATSGPQVTPTRLARQLVYCSGTPEVTEIERGLWRVECDYR